MIFRFGAEFADEIEINAVGNDKAPVNDTMQFGFALFKRNVVLRFRWFCGRSERSLLNYHNTLLYDLHHRSGCRRSYVVFRCLQERRQNFMPFYAARGAALFDEWLEALDPLDPRFSVLEE